MKNIHICFLSILLSACNDNIQYLREIADAIVQDGVELRIGKPEQTGKDDILSFEHIPIKVSNLSSDTIYFENIFVFYDDHPIWGNFDFVISDQNEDVYTSDSVFRHYYEMLDHNAEYIMLSPGASFQDKILVSLERYYKLKKGKTYSIFAKYVNRRIYTTDLFPTQLPSGKQLWTGTLKSNTYQFKF